MDREQLRNQAQSRRSRVVSEPEQKKVTWRCEFCSRDFVQERSFMSHFCKERERIDELRGATGQAAYAHYSEWMKAKKRSVPSIEAFATSSFYSTFVKFAEHAAKTNIPNIRQFIKMMVEHNDVSPGLWCRDNVYALYLEWYDQAFPPEVQVIDSLDFIKALAADYEVDVSEVFKSVPIDTLVQHIRRRKLSAWLLAASKVFRSHLLTCSPEDKDKLERAMNMGAMIARIQKQQDLFLFFNKVTAAEGL